MSVAAIVFFVIAGLALIYAVFTYNSMVALKNNVAMAWANIDVLLKQRHDEIPKLVETCRQYTRFERGTLENVTAARNAVAGARERQDIGALGTAEETLRGAIGRLFAVAEAYPELKADENFRHLQVRITGLENAIADRREFYNDSVNVNNVRIEQFPDTIIASMFGFGPQPLLRFASTEKRDPDLKKLFA